MLAAAISVSLRQARHVRARFECPGTLPSQRPANIDSNHIKELIENIIQHETDPTYSKYPNQLLKIICTSLAMLIASMCEENNKYERTFLFTIIAYQLNQYSQTIAINKIPFCCLFKLKIYQISCLEILNPHYAFIPQSISIF